MSGRLTVTPPVLGTGDVIAIASPASAVDPQLIEGAAAALRAEGFGVIVMPHAAGRTGSFSGSLEERLADFQTAIDNPAVKAILCGRGGYGAVQLLTRLRLHRPLWIAGFSDISALHALAHARGFRSIHSSMAKELTLRRCPGDEANRRLLDILRTGHMPAVEFPAHPLNREGRATGMLIGGNLAVLDALVGTPFNLLQPDSILAIEDVSEPIYKVERMLWRLSLSGVLDRLRGLVIGQFTDYKPSADWADMYSMIARFTSQLKCPVAFGAPFGHIDGNLPFVEGAEVTLEVGASVVIAESTCG